MLYLLLLLLIGCREVTQQELLQSAQKNVEKKHYKQAGKRYFQLWCTYPELDYLHKAIEYLSLAGQMSTALKLAHDYTILTDDPLDLIKGMGYYAQVTHAYKNTHRAKKALAHLKAANGPRDAIEYLEQVIECNDLQQAKLCINQRNPFGALRLLNQPYKHQQNIADQMRQNVQDNMKHQQAIGVNARP